jgi:hypothetical protein
MSNPIVVTVCIACSSESWEPYWRLAKFVPTGPVHDRFEPSQIPSHKQGFALISGPEAARRQDGNPGNPLVQNGGGNK